MGSYSLAAERSCLLGFCFVFGDKDEGKAVLLNVGNDLTKDKE